MGIKAFITGVQGTALSADECAFISDEHPWGLILFARNIETPKQVRKLIDEFRERVERSDAPVLIDQEGGRVQRLRPPHWQDYEPGWTLGDLWRHDRKAGERAIFLQSRLIAHDLQALGINVDCLPVLDVPVPGGHEVIGDRAYSNDPAEVGIMGRIACEGLLDGGVLPVIKHIPGHGRAGADSHKELPVVDVDPELLRETDFEPFRVLADMPLAMTAHVKYTGLDPDWPATTSARIIKDIIRGEIGYSGLLMSDDLSMEALEGDYESRTQSCLEAGCDMILHCNGKFSEMCQVASVSPVLAGAPLDRANRAFDWLHAPNEIDVDALRAEYRGLLEPSV